MANQEIYVFGKPCPLHVSLDEALSSPKLTYTEGIFYLKLPNAEPIALEKLLKPIMTKLLKPLVEQYMAIYQPQLKLKAKSVTYEDSEVRWGSCNGKRELTFNWKLSMLPNSVVRYVVVHELCHMAHMNHDRSFWRLVGKLDPDYKSAMAILGNTKRSE